MLKKGITAMFGAAMLFGSTACASVARMDKIPEPPQEYLDWLNDLKEEMIARGISAETVNQAFAKNYYHPEHDVVKKDRKQAEFVMTTTDYVNRLVNAKKADRGRRKYKELYPQYKSLEKQYGVPFNYIVSFWGMETDYGRTFGNYHVIEVLTVLSYDQRRSKFFRGELYQALKIIDAGNVTVDGMEGSWAGAMGHFQFMPSTFNAYAVDYDRDGKIDIWQNYGDAAASAANYLSKMGWKQNETWGMAVSLPWNFDYAQSGRQTRKTIAEWRKLGVKTESGRRLPLDSKLSASVIVPEGRRGRAYLVTDNFRKIMNWNRSENYALGVALLADYVKSGKKWQPLRKNPVTLVKTEDVILLQEFINNQGWGKLDADGQLGAKTREAVKMLQKKARLPQDGYPDNLLLQKIKNYNPEIGFAVPVQPQKPAQKNASSEKKSNSQG